MALVWCSFMEAVTPGQRQLWQGGIGQCPLTHQSARSQARDSHSQSSSENWGVTVDPNIAQRWSIAQAKVGQPGSGSEEEFEDSRDHLDPGDQIELLLSF